MTTFPGLKLFAILVFIAPFLQEVRLAHAQGTATVTGVVKDAVYGTTLPSVNISIVPVDSVTSATGTITDQQGRYEVSGLSAGRYVLTGSHAAYEPYRYTFSLAEGAVRTLDFDLEIKIYQLEDVQVTVTRLPGKTLESPTAVDVVHGEEIGQDVTTSPVESLRRVPGLDLARTGIDRRELVLRGFGKTFTGATYVMTDYRQSAVASLGVNAYNMMPISSIDLEQVEVVRGPAGAVYGPGVDEGAIHFISKNPFDYPGTTIAISGGQQSMMQGELRHAGVVGDNLGYKINAQYLNAEEWRLDPSDPHDAELIQRYYSEMAPDTDVTKLIVSGTAAYRFNPRTVLTATAGYGSAKSPFLSDIGPLQSDGFGYRFGQLRLQAGRFFAQAYLNANDAGDSFVYAGPGVAESLSGQSVVDNSTQLNVQAQYGLDFAQGRERITIGADFEQTNPSTDGTINGRNEEGDRIVEYGVYAQSLSKLPGGVDLHVAARVDYDNIFEKMQVSPRAAVVYKPTEQQALRASVSRAFASPGTNSLFLDILARRADVVLPFDVRARGAAQGFTFDHNPAFSGFAASDLVATSIIPDAAFFGRPVPVGLPLDQTYGWIYGGLSQIPIPVLTQILCDEGICLEEEQVAYLRSELAPDQTNVVGFSDGSLGMLDLSTGGIEPVGDAPAIAPLKQPTTQTFEVGYRGRFGGRVGVTLNGYYSEKEDFVRGLQLETPFVLVPQLREDLVPAIRDGIMGNVELETALRNLGLPPEAVAALLVQLADPSLPSTEQPIAVVQPSENNPGEGLPPELLMTYRNFGRVAFYGLEASVDVILNNQTMLFGSLSWTSDDYFDHEELNEENEDLFVSLNAPTFKAGTGLSYAAERSFSFSLGGRYVQGFTVRSGPYNGYIDDYFLLDVGAGYDFGQYAPGLRLDVTVQNVLDHRHREFIGAPKMGRLGLARLTYTFR